MKKATTSKKRIQKKSKPVDQQLLDSARTLVNFSKLSPPNQGWTQEEAALNLCVAPHMYKRWESGERVPHISTLLKLEAVAGIDWQAWMSVREGWQQVCS